MKIKIWLVLVLAVACSMGALAESKGKYAIILQSGNETNEGKSRAAHALLYAAEFAENGYEVVLVFDGAGTGWAQVFEDSGNPLHKLYLKIHELGVVEKICDHCADANEVKEMLSDQQRKMLVSEYRGHSSLVKWIEQGYQVIVL